MKNKRRNITIIIIVLIILFVVGGVVAYLQDTDTKTNIFTLGRVKIELTESNFVEANAQNVKPGDEIAKDPKITNIGTNSAYVYIKVINPIENLSNGKGPLFSYTTNSGWTQLDEVEDCNYKITTYYYNTDLDPNVSTTTLFDTVTLNNYSNDSDPNKDLVIYGYAIQSSYLASGSTITSIFSSNFSNDLSDTTITCPGMVKDYTGGECADIINDSSGGEGNANMSGLTLMMKNATQGEDDSSWFKDSAANQSQAGIYTRNGTSNDKYPIYYYRGAYGSVNNNLIFNNYCWKIVRTTATGGIRIIYNGPANNGQCTNQTGSTTYATTGRFNTTLGGIQYIKYQFDNSGTLTDSNLKVMLENWYNNNMRNVDNKIEVSLYCNDTTIWKDSNYTDPDVIAAGWHDYRESDGVIDYCPLLRAIKGTPTTLCSKESDAYRVKVGFLTSDEVALAGRSWSSGMQDYLYTGTYYWLGSPGRYASSYSHEYYVYNDDDLSNYWYMVGPTYGVRPVVTLKANTNYTGTGTTTDPFIVN